MLSLNSVSFVLLGVMATLQISEAIIGTCRDLVSADECRSFRALGLCKTQEYEMRDVCTKTCGFCTPCEDKINSSRCATLNARGACTTDYRRMKNLCAKTCGYCALDCFDKRISCKSWSTPENCTANGLIMATECPSSCDFCGGTTPCDSFKCPLTAPCELHKNGTAYCKCNPKCDGDRLTGPVCASNGTREVTFEHLCALRREECNSENFYKVKHYGHCMKRATCHDEIEGTFVTACSVWKKKGACDKERGVMQLYCPRTCRLCRQPAPLPVCHTSPFGCCWNSDRPANDVYGAGCKACKDKPFCRYFAFECGNTRNLAHMRSHCPGMCRYCLTKQFLDARVSS